MKKYLSYILILTLLIGFFFSFTSLKAQEGGEPTQPGLPGGTLPGTPVAPETSPQPYQLLTPLPDTNGGTMNTFDPTDAGAFSRYLNLMIKLFIGICAVLAMIMIIIGGLEYMTSELVSSKESGKHKITGAILGLLLALGSYAILNTINPDLLNSDLGSLKDVTIKVNFGGDSNTAFTPVSKSVLTEFGIDCSGTGGKPAIENIGKQFVNKTIYSKEKRGQATENKLYYDCSSFVAQVYNCAGLSNPGSYTGTMFANGLRVVGKDYNFSNLNSGDLIGWTPGDDSEGNGHVMIYLGDNKILDSSSSQGGVSIRTLTDEIKKKITYVKWDRR